MRGAVRRPAGNGKDGSDASAPAAGNPEELLHELQVHQIELEMQNESLRRTQVQLADSHDRYVDLFDLAPVAYLTLSADGTISQVNPACAELFGLPREKMLNRRFQEFALPASRERAEELLAVVQERDGRRGGELALRRADGAVLTVEFACRRIAPPHGPPLLHMALTDISERKRAEEQLRIAATAFESQEGMMVMDGAQTILRVNRAFVDITGYAAGEVVGRSIEMFDAGRHDADFYYYLWETARTTGFWQGEVWARRKDGEVFPELLTISAVRGDDGEITHYVGSLTDNTLRKAEEEKIKHLAFYDSLTQLPNRQLLLNRLQQALAASERSGREGALLFIDLDHFKALNDSLGHGMGDLLLQQVAQRLSTCIREGDTVARLGGDEFVVMLEDLSDDLKEAASQIEAVGEKILATLNKIYDLDGHPYHSTPSIGATLFRDHRESVSELLKSADLAMYHAKAAGRNVLRFFNQNMQAEVTARLRLEGEMREALLRGQFMLHFQAQVDANGHLTGAEALLRWLHPTRKLLSPPDFIGLAEETGLIIPIGQWVLETVCRQLASWATLKDLAHLSLTVNVSPREFRQPGFVNNVLSTIARCGTDPHKLCLEFTETLLSEDLEETANKISALRSAGIRLALSNFGCGASSLACLRHLPLDQIKLGRRFVRNLPDDARDLSIARSVAVLGEGLGMDVVAEGVETDAQCSALRHLGFNSFQGYLFSRPLPIVTKQPAMLH